MVITFIANWYAVIPDNLTENDCFHSLQFRNMKFHYPIIYITYEALIIFIISILYARSFTIEVVLAVQILYLLFILWIWPYNTPRKINRILHNLTILFNQMTEIFATIVVMRWRILLPGEQSSKSNYEALAYFFIIFILLVTSLVLAIIRLAIFNKDVDCCQRDMEIE